MIQHLRPAFVMTALFTLLLGLAYPLGITSLAQAVMPNAAQGSLIRRDGAVVGSQLIGQATTSPRYFWPRPSATAPDPYNASASSGANLGPTSAKLAERVKSDIERLHTAGIAGPLPADAATASGSGLDPHISPAFARAQIARVARERGMTEAQLSDLVGRVEEGRLLGFIGEPRVNVLRLNLALDAMKS
ncbi:potassium-transporting ATPase subunit C [Xaviernesmea oryzae]|uniref:Potassium-transporting ATPase KdpC subunit n=1 Tax=Xaviernesmea oryzae TaxID=464029 RepID=A0A1Q9B1J9_9HYPH|nr:potassium-transporting ATPase subunit KdpC [Xaviernesmea oryzae]OLP61878.1 potassium-transporting ATPase subunit C [Xaviernesmea oryzae]SEL74599.1 K+-transporting ATPase ATPase C chain [Xaviernesmea oryzae]